MKYKEIIEYGSSENKRGDLQDKQNPEAQLEKRYDIRQWLYWSY